MSKRYELTIKIDYLPGWGTMEGLRELLQNAKDSEVEFDAPMDVRVRDTTLVITNEGTTLPYEALLLGHTTKVGRSEMIGKFGEGFKLGVLALLRAGHDVKIRNGSEVWIPTIEFSDKFNAKVLVFTIHTGRKEEDRVQIEVKGITPEFFRDEIRPRFLWLDTDSKRVDDSVTTDAGTLLLSDRYKGKLFVKGIFVEHKPDLSYGYNFSDADVDRDRRMVSSYDFQYKCRQIWQTATATRPDLLDPFVTLLEANSPEVQGIDSWAAKYFSEELVEHVAAKFTARNGDKAIAVKNLADSAELDHLGKRGVIVTGAMQAILERKQGSVETVKKALANEVVKTLSWHDMTDEMKSNLTRAVNLVSPFAKITLETISVVEYRSPKLMGMHSATGVSLAAKIVADRKECLATLIHEVAHDKGADAEHAHVAEIERIWASIVDTMP